MRCDISGSRLAASLIETEVHLPFAPGAAGEFARPSLPAPGDEEEGEHDTDFGEQPDHFGFWILDGS